MRYVEDNVFFLVAKEVFERLRAIRLATRDVICEAGEDAPVARRSRRSGNILLQGLHITPRVDATVRWEI